MRTQAEIFGVILRRPSRGGIRIWKVAIPLLLTALFAGGGAHTAPGQTSTNRGITVALPSGWKFVAPKEGSVFSLQATAIGSRMTCQIRLYSLKENTSSRAYAEATRSDLKRTFPEELISEHVFTTKVGGEEAAGFTWLHSGSDAEVDVMVVRSTRALTLDFEKMQLKIDQPAMKALLEAVHF